MKSSDGLGCTFSTKTPASGHARARLWLALCSGMLFAMLRCLVKAKLQHLVNYRSISSGFSFDIR
jgi:hypothetical protein